jgi:molybdopterin synthase catalytic subunit
VGQQTSAPAGPRVEIREADFDVSAELDALRAGDGAVGGLVAFVGTVRDASDGRDVATLELEHYPGMTERAIEAMVEAAITRFGIRAAKVIHRVGRLTACDRIVLVAVAAAHRGEAFQAAEFLMDWLKTEAPFWKKERDASGEGRWVDARSADDRAARRWGIVSSNAGLDPPA